MKELGFPVYVRFGNIPGDGISRIHRGDEIIGKEKGLSVYKAVYSDGVYYPQMEEIFNEIGVADYMHYVLNVGDYNPILLVSGDVVGRGSGHEPILQNVNIIKDITDDIWYQAGILTPREAAVPTIQMTYHTHEVHKS